MTQKSELGKFGEDAACEFLKKNRFKILDRNFRRSWGEIDIVALGRKSGLVFVEVKTMAEGELSPEDNFTAEKRRRLVRTCGLCANAEEYKEFSSKGWRIDLIAITVSFDNGIFSVKNLRHYENV